MAILTTRYFSTCLNGSISFTAVIPFEDFGNDFRNMNPKPYSNKEPLKTLYLLHGVTDDEKSWLYNSRIARFAEEHHIAVILPDGNNNFYVDNCLTERWGEFIGRELVEFTRTLFPLSDKREDTFIGGLSMGGYGAIRNGLKYNDTFSKIVALSSALVLYDAPNYTEEGLPIKRKSYIERLFGPVEQIPGSDADVEQLYLDVSQPVSIFMAIGDDDSLKDVNRRYKAFLESQNADLTYYEEPGNHEWDFWDRNIRVALDWLLK